MTNAVCHALKVIVIVEGTKRRLRLRLLSQRMRRRAVRWRSSRPLRGAIAVIARDHVLLLPRTRLTQQRRRACAITSRSGTRLTSSRRCER